MEPEEREERGPGRSQNVVHTLPRSMASVPSFLTGPLERVDPAAGSTQVLVITADPETAVALAEAVLRMTGHAGIELLPVTSARRAGRLMAGRPVLAAAGSPRDLRDLVRSSHIKLESVKAVVLAWADEILAGDPEDIEALEAVMSELPKDAARIVVASRAEGRVNAFAERYLRRAHRDVPIEAEEEPVSLQYVTVTATSRATGLRRLLDDMDPPSAAIIVADDDAEREVSKTLRLLGYGSDSASVRVTRGEIEPSTHAVIFYEAPTSRSMIAAAAKATPVSIVALTDPRELAALKRTAGGDVKPFALSSPGNAARDRDIAMRRELSGILESGVASREVLALEPLLERYDGIEIAAAALRILERERTLRKAAKEEHKAQQETGARAPAGRPDFERRPPGRGFSDSRGPRDGGSGRPAPSGRGERRPPRDSSPRPPRRDRS
ncbi:MAG: DEAD/DEAH box helicase [Gemmatimonadaceae bacterium]|nr:DEAD/DEAH box helicase [Gemmatimonadaceae bacterium]